jgi:transposase, IS5 family
MKLRRGLRLQIKYLKRDIRIINGLLDRIKAGRVPFDKHQNKYLFVIQHVLEQQESMFKDKANSCQDRIVNIHQSHVRPIVRGKAKAKFEFGAKINVSHFPGSFLKWIFANVMKMKEQIILTMMPNQKKMWFGGIIQ